MTAAIAPALYSNGALSDKEVDTIVAFLDDQGWTYEATESDATYKVWTRTFDGDNFAADIWENAGRKVFEIYRASPRPPTGSRQSDFGEHPQSTGA